MQKILHLPQDVIAKIAAGEVIERPAYAVKELLENAIDAGADVIQIHVEEAGLKRIIVSDNGEGMSRDDIELCYLAHTTSKLSAENQLVGLNTLGFRGEALSSIAAISDMTIQSRTRDSVGGTAVKLRGGQTVDISPIGTPPGTIIIVDNLFHSVPARKKFLKSAQTEFRHITDIVLQYALSYPAIHFVLTHNTKTIFDLPKKQDLFERIKLLLGSSLYEQLIPLKYEDGYISLSGFIGRPQFASKQNQKQFLFVNNRSVTDRMLSLAVKEAFGTLLPSSNTPVFLLHISLPPEAVDVNVHPRKEQVVFINAKALFDAVKQAVTDSLQEHNLTFRLAAFKQEHSARIGETTSFAGELLRQTVLTPEKISTELLIKNAPYIQIDTTYILTLTREGILIVDQHAAHERILYEQFVKAFETQKKKKESLPLPKSLTLTLSIPEAQIMEEQSSLFEQLGFVIEHFQGTSYLIRSIPVLFEGRHVEKIVRDILDDLNHDTLLKSIDLRSQRMLAFLSCRAAVKAGDRLSEAQMKKILKELDETERNATCPHGRPTRTTLTLEQLHKLFRRL